MPARRNSDTPLHPPPFFCVVCNHTRRHHKCRKHKREVPHGRHVATFEEGGKAYAVYEVLTPYLHGEVNIITDAPLSSPHVPHSA